MKEKESASGKTGGGNKPDHLDGDGQSNASYKPGYPIDRSLQEASESDLKRGFKPGG